MDPDALQYAENWMLQYLRFGSVLTPQQKKKLLRYFRKEMSKGVNKDLSEDGQPNEQESE